MQAAVEKYYFIRESRFYFVNKCHTKGTTLTLNVFLKFNLFTSTLLHSPLHD